MNQLTDLILTIFTDKVSNAQVTWKWPKLKGDHEWSVDKDSEGRDKT